MVQSISRNQGLHFIFKISPYKVNGLTLYYHFGIISMSVANTQHGIADSRFDSALCLLSCASWRIVGTSKGRILVLLRSNHLNSAA